MRLDQKTAVVTGGSRGIGRAIALALAAEGAKVAIVARSAERAEEATRLVKDTGTDAISFAEDVSDPESAGRVIDVVVERWGRLDILVNSAGIIRDGLFLQLSPEDWNAVIATNLNGTFFFCKAAGREMMGKRAGSIINLSSVAARHSNKGQSNYAASKAGIEALTRTLAAELAGRKVRVNAIAPGFVETEMTEQVRALAGDKIKSAIPMKRLGQPEDIAKVAIFLASDESQYMTGQVLTVDGGLSLGAQA